MREIQAFLLIWLLCRDCNLVFFKLLNAPEWPSLCFIATLEAKIRRMNFLKQSSTWKALKITRNCLSLFILGSLVGGAGKWAQKSKGYWNVGDTPIPGKMSFLKWKLQLGKLSHTSGCLQHPKQTLTSPFSNSSRESSTSSFGYTSSKCPCLDCHSYKVVPLV